MNRYDLHKKEIVYCNKTHSEDINTIALTRNPYTLLSGSDDAFIFMTDIRLPLDESPVKAFIGHHEGITHLQCKDNSDTYFISNSKDQSIKLWDSRAGNTFEQTLNPDTTRIPDFDYRYDIYPSRNFRNVSKYDTSLLTMRGHLVLRTLIKCHFSPSNLTNQKYIYSASANGQMVVYDAFTGELVCRRSNIDGSIMRDALWNSMEPIIVTPSFSGEVSLWKWKNIKKKDTIMPLISYNDSELNEF